MNHPIEQGIGGNRLAWAEVPAHVRRTVEDAVGPVVHAADQPGGFSPGCASRLLLADGRRVFVKAVGLERNAFSPDMHRREARLAPHVPGPELIFTHDDGDWVALVFADVAGRTPALPWRPDEWQRVFDAVVRLCDRDGSALPFVGRHDEAFSGWRQSARQPPPDLDPWALANLDRLARAESEWTEAVRGTALLHGDLRADNVLLTDDDVVFVDWPHAASGAPWADLVFLLPSVAMQGGPSPEDVWQASPYATTADPDAVTAVLAAVAGFFVHSSRQPPPPGLPSLRAFQAAQGVCAVDWLRARFLR